MKGSPSRTRVREASAVTKRSVEAMSVSPRLLGVAPWVGGGAAETVTSRGCVRADLEGPLLQGLEAILDGEGYGGTGAHDLHGRGRAASEVLGERRQVGDLRVLIQGLGAPDLQVEHELPAHGHRVAGAQVGPHTDVLAPGCQRRAQSREGEEDRQGRRRHSAGAVHGYQTFRGRRPRVAAGLRLTSSGSSWIASRSRCASARVISPCWGSG